MLQPLLLAMLFWLSVVLGLVRSPPPQLCRRQVAGGSSSSRSSSSSSSSSSRSSSSHAAAARTEDLQALVARRVAAHGPKLVSGLSSKGYYYADNFLGREVLRTLRAEAVGLYERGQFVKSQSARWCPIEKKQILYDKHNVFSTQLLGGDAFYAAPRLHEYVVALVRTAVPLLNSQFPDKALLSPTLASNKLACCTGDGSAYDKHYDNAGLDDLRKVTVLYYMNADWRPELGGAFRIYNPDDSVTDVEPRGDRMLVFWSDKLVHSVEPSFAPGGARDHRYALTVWLTTTSPAAIDRDDAMIKRHFGGGGGGV